MTLCSECEDSQLAPVPSIFSKEDVQKLQMHDPTQTKAVMDDVCKSDGNLFKTLLEAATFRKHLHSSPFRSNLGHFVMSSVSMRNRLATF